MIVIDKRMRTYINIVMTVAMLLGIATSSFAQSSNYKCMIQMNAFQGEPAYVAISLVDSKGAYLKTLGVLGPDKQWYNTLTEWYAFQSQAKEQLSAISSASIAAGDRVIKTLSIEDDKLGKGYKLRFETAVEEKNYYAGDVEIPLTAAGLAAGGKGKGYIRLVKLIKVK